MIITRSWPSATTRDWAIIQTNMTLRLLLKGKTIFQQSSWSSHKGHPYNHHDQHDHDDDVNDGQEGPLVGGQKGEWGHPQMHKGSASEAALTSRWSGWSWSDGEKKLKKTFWLLTIGERKHWNCPKYVLHILISLSTTLVLVTQLAGPRIHYMYSYYFLLLWLHWFSN